MYPRGHLLNPIVNIKHYCVICNEEFSNKKSLPSHLLKVHGVKSFSCDTCGKRFAYRHSMELHVRHYHEKRFSCDICYKRFVYNHSLTRHLKENHCMTNIQITKRKRLAFDGKVPGADKKFKHKCAVCYKRFTCKYSLVNHMESHEKLLGVIKYKCDICPNEYTRKDTLKRHMLVHNNEL